MIKIKFDGGINERNKFLSDFYNAIGFKSIDIDFDMWLDDNYGVFIIKDVIEIKVGWFED